MIPIPLRPLLSLALLLGLLACTHQDQTQPALRLAKSDSLVVSFDQAKKLLERGDNAEAVSAFRSLLRQDRKSVPVMNGLAIAYAELGRPDLAAGFFADALAISPEDPTTLNNIGFAALRRKDVELALNYLKKAKRHGDNTPEIEGNLALLARLEARNNSVAAKPVLSPAELPNRTFELQRETVSKVRLSDIRTGSDAQATARIPASSQSTMTLIDFNDLFDPWSAVPMDKPSL